MGLIYSYCSDHSCTRNNYDRTNQVGPYGRCNPSELERHEIQMTFCLTSPAASPSPFPMYMLQHLHSPGHILALPQKLEFFCKARVEERKKRNGWMDGWMDGCESESRSRISNVHPCGLCLDHSTTSHAHCPCLHDPYRPTPQIGTMISFLSTTRPLAVHRSGRQHR